MDEIEPANPRAWRQWADIAALFASATDREWIADRELLDGGLPIRSRTTPSAC